MSRSVTARSWFPRTGAGPEAGAALAISGRHAPADDVVAFTSSAHDVNVTIQQNTSFAHSPLLLVAAEPSGVDDHVIAPAHSPCPLCLLRFLNSCRPHHPGRLRGRQLQPTQARVANSQRTPSEPAARAPTIVTWGSRHGTTKTRF